MGGALTLPLGSKQASCCAHNWESASSSAITPAHTHIKASLCGFVLRQDPKSWQPWPLEALTSSATPRERRYLSSCTNRSPRNEDSHGSAPYLHIAPRLSPPDWSSKGKPPGWWEQRKDDWGESLDMMVGGLNQGEVLVTTELLSAWRWVPDTETKYER